MIPDRALHGQGPATIRDLLQSLSSRSLNPLVSIYLLFIAPGLKLQNTVLWRLLHHHFGTLFLWTQELWTPGTP